MNQLSPKSTFLPYPDYRKSLSGNSLSLYGNITGAGTISTNAYNNYGGTRLYGDNSGFTGTFIFNGGNAAVQGGQEVALPVLAATLTTVVVFFPVTFLYGVSRYLFSALALARTGNIARAQALTEELEKAYPTDTVLKFYWLPTIHAAMELNRNNPLRALQHLEAATAYEMGCVLPGTQRPGLPCLCARVGIPAFAQWLCRRRGVPEVGGSPEHRVEPGNGIAGSPSDCSSVLHCG